MILELDYHLLWKHSIAVYKAPSTLIFPYYCLIASSFPFVWTMVSIATSHYFLSSSETLANQHHNNLPSLLNLNSNICLLAVENSRSKLEAFLVQLVEELPLKPSHKLLQEVSVTDEEPVNVYCPTSVRIYLYWYWHYTR